MTFNSDGAKGGRAIGATYAADQDGVLLEESDAGSPEPRSFGDIIPPTERRRVREASSSRARPERRSKKRPTARIAQLDSSCQQGGYSFWPYRIYGYYYYYEARTTSMPNGDADRSIITRGHHTWNNTMNPCGFPDVTPVTAYYQGPTSHTVHTYIDNHNVVDFGDPTVLGCSAPAGKILLACTSMLSADGVGAADVDQRYTNRPSTFYSGTGSSVSSTRFDLWSTASHESGHAVGLGEGSGYLLTMYPSIDSGTTLRRDLGFGDAQGFRCRYGITEGGC